MSQSTRLAQMEVHTEKPYRSVMLDATLVQRLKVRASECGQSIKAFVEEGLAIAGDKDPRFRFEDGGRK